MIIWFGTEKYSWTESFSLVFLDDKNFADTFSHKQLKLKWSTGM